MTAPTAKVAARADLFEAAKGTSALWACDKGTRVPRLSLFGLEFDNTSLQLAVAETVAAARASHKRQIGFVNAHVINTAKADRAYHRVLAQCDTLFSDGSGMAIAAKLAGQPFVANTNGTDFFPSLCRAATAEGVTIFLLGGSDGVAERAADTIRAAGFGQAIAGTHHGYFKAGSVEENAAIDAINASGADIVLAGLGVPYQDIWLQQNRARLNPTVAAGVGGLFDFFSGNVSRAPLAMRRVGLEWVWRLMLEPRRLWQRYLIGNVVFLSHALVEAARRKASLSSRAASPAAEPAG